jgi:hypothetical protein
VSARKTLINESPNADFFGAINIPKSRPDSRFFQVVEFAESAKLIVGWYVPNAESRNKPITHFRVAGEKYLKILKVFGSFQISLFIENSIAKFSKIKVLPSDL